METLKFKRALRFYLSLPIHITIVLAIFNIPLYYLSKKIGFLWTLLVIVYLITTSLIYNINKKRLAAEMVDFAVTYGTVQKRLLKSLGIPYVLLDERGKVVWSNDRFRELIGVDENYHKSISQYFTEITASTIERSGENGDTFTLKYNDRVFDAALRKLSFEESDDKGKEIDFEAGINSLTALLLFDVTELTEVKKQKEDQAMVPAYIYIDNYDDTVDAVEDVKKAMLQAVIDRTVNEYMEKAGAVVRKTEKDKYFAVFEHQYLKQMEDDKFKILEDVKNIKMGNDNDVTLSIGIGVNGNSYIQNAEYARMAINIALGRGGSQAVIKDNQDVSYYGIHGKEVEKNTRVKARVKAQALREIMEGRENVLIMGHSISDADAFGAAVGVFCAARELGKRAQIVLNTTTVALRPLRDLFTVENGYPEDMIVDSEQALSNLTSRSLVVVVDTNRAGYTECPELLTRCRSIVVLDHHRQGTDQIENPLLSYIEPYASSACEMIAEILQYFTEKINLKSQEADAIYAGILIDTNNFMTKTGVRTFEAAAYLRRNGAEMTRVRKLLREDMDTYKARAEVVRNASVYRKIFAISVCDAAKLESPTVVGAQAANELLSITGIKASFVLTEYQHKIYVSGRSIDEIDVQKILERLGGGGHLNVAGAQIEDSTTSHVKIRIENVLDQMIDEGEIVL